jgi:5-methylcytosine-specific restriction protein A
VVHRGRYCAEHQQQRQRWQDVERGSAAERGYDARWRKVRKRFLRAHPLCAECERLGFVTAATDVDHIMPKNRGGADTEDNLQALCHAHHSAKTMRELRVGVRGSNL